MSYTYYYMDDCARTPGTLLYVILCSCICTCAHLYVRVHYRVKISINIFDLIRFLKIRSYTLSTRSVNALERSVLRVRPNRGHYKILYMVARMRRGGYAIDNNYYRARQTHNVIIIYYIVPSSPPPIESVPNSHL